MSFAEALREMRRDAGFATPRAFYNSRGGRRFFGCTYRQYSNVEAGRTLASPRLFEKVASALGLASDPARARRLCSAYLRAWLGDEALCSFMLRSLGAPRLAPPAGPMARAVAQSHKARLKSLTPEQTALITGSLEGHWAFAVLTHDDGRWTPAQLARVTRLSAAKLRRALERFAATGLFRRDSEGRYWCPEPEREFQLARTGLGPPNLGGLRRHFQRLAARHGGARLVKNLCLRASEAELEAYLPQLLEPGYKGIGLLSAASAGPDTAFFQVETVVRKLMAF
jgi:hypothetical protein